MVFTKSPIQWKRSEEGQNYGSRPPTVYYKGTAGSGCDFYIHVYGYDNGHWNWNWSIRSQKYHINLIVGHTEFKTWEEASRHAAKWAFVQFLRKLDPNFTRRMRNENNIVSGLEPITEEHLRRGVPWFNEVEQDSH
jgi:hypothetical protein